MNQHKPKIVSVIVSFTLLVAVCVAGLAISQSCIGPLFSYSVLSKLWDADALHINVIHAYCNKTGIFP